MLTEWFSETRPAGDRLEFVVIVKCVVGCLCLGPDSGGRLYSEHRQVATSVCWRPINITGGFETSFKELRRIPVGGLCFWRLWSAHFSD